MATRTWEMKVLDRTIQVKMKKDDAKDVMTYHLHKVLNIQQHQIETSGTIMPDGSTKDEHVWGSMSLFGVVGTLSAEGIAERQKLVAELPALIDYENVKQVAEVCKAFYEKYVTRKDNRRTLAQVTEQHEKSNQFAVEREAKQKKESEASAIATAGLREQYPYLTLLEGSDKRSQVIAAVNIRIQLVRAFPGQQFSVTSEAFSMGDAVRIHWTDGPTTEEVREISAPYAEGHFDGMDDSYKDHDSPWHIFGHSKYVSESRQISKERYLEVAKELGLSITITDGGYIEGGEDVDTVKQETWKRSFYVKPENGNEAPQECTRAVVTKNEERQGIEIRFAGKPNADVLETLKANGFRWSRYQKLWWTRYSEQKMVLANELAGIGG